MKKKIVGGSSSPISCLIFAWSLFMGLNHDDSIEPRNEGRKLAASAQDVSQDMQCKEQHQRAVQEDAKAEGEIHAGEEQGAPSRSAKLVWGA